MVRVLYVINGVFSNGGTEAFILNYYKNFDKKQISIDFIVHGDELIDKNNKVHQYLEKCGSNIFYVTPRGKSFIQNRRDIMKILTQNKYDIIHTHMDASGKFVLKLAKKIGIKVRIAHSHNTDHVLQIKSIKSYLHYIILEYSRINIKRYANIYMACSEEAGIWLFGKQNMKEGNINIIRNAIDSKKFRYDENIRTYYREKMDIQNSFVIGHIGRFTEQKNHDFLIDIFYKVYKKNDKAKLLLIGDGELKEEIINKVKSMDLQDKVISYGVTNDIHKIIQTIDVFVLPSIFEGLGIVNIESQSAGIKCVVSDRVPREAKVTDNIEFVSLNKTDDEWAEKILKYSDGYERLDMHKQIIVKGYDIIDNSKILQDIYIRNKH